MESVSRCRSFEANPKCPAQNEMIEQRKRNSYIGATKLITETLFTFKTLLTCSFQCFSVLLLNSKLIFLKLESLDGPPLLNLLIKRNHSVIMIESN